MDIGQIRLFPQASQAPAVPVSSPDQSQAAVATPAQTSNQNLFQDHGDQAHQQSENARLSAVESAARTLKQAFPEFETFTIFKNTSGEFITRITNHTTGRVQYIPEVNILEYFKNDSAKSTLALQA